MIDWDDVLKEALVFHDAVYGDWCFPPGYHMNYILDEQGQPVPSEDSSAIGRLSCDIKKRKIADSTVHLRGVRVEISTVFSTYNYDHTFSSTPVLWETMTFSRRGGLNHWQERYSSREEAVSGHMDMVCAVMRELQRHPCSVRRRKVAERKKREIEPGWNNE